FSKSLSTISTRAPVRITIVLRRIQQDHDSHNFNHKYQIRWPRQRHLARTAGHPLIDVFQESSLIDRAIHGETTRNASPRSAFAK
ncbi:hypothetical protein ACQY0O_002192, partial [Thecaphora frezii]